MATKNPPKKGRYIRASAYACAFPRRPCDTGGGSGPGSPEDPGSPAYSCGTAPASHRLPLLGPFGRPTPNSELLTLYETKSSRLSVGIISHRARVQEGARDFSTLSAAAPRLALALTAAAPVPIMSTARTRSSAAP